MKKLWRKALAYMLVVAMCAGVIKVPVNAQESVGLEGTTEIVQVAEEVIGETYTVSGNDTVYVNTTVSGNETVSGNDLEENVTEEEVIAAEEVTEETTVAEWDQTTKEKEFIGENYKVTFTLDSSWDGGYNAKIKLENTGDTTIQNWYLGFDYNNAITNIWNAVVSEQDENTYVIKNAGWN